MNEKLTIRDMKNAAQEITDSFVQSKRILFFQGRAYEKHDRFYCPLASEEQLTQIIYSVLNPDQVSQISTRQVKEAIGRIMNHPALQYDFESERKKNEKKLNLLNGVFDIEENNFTAVEGCSHYDYILNFRIEAMRRLIRQRRS